MTTVPQLAPAAWYELLFSETEGWVNVFADRKGSKKSLWARSAEDFATHVAQLPDHDVWFGCCTRKNKGEGLQRGRADECLEIPGAWIDIDVLGPNHKDVDNLPPDEQSALKLIKAFPLRPTALLRTGGGFQGWWLFPEPLYTEDATAFLERWGATWKELGARFGWGVDSVWDIPRMLRVPGTLNHKSDPALPVTTAHVSPDRRYALADLDEYTVDLAAMPSLPPRTPYEGAERAGDRYNAATDPSEPLLAAGCHFDHQNRDGARHFRAPHHTNDHICGITIYPEPDLHTTIYSQTFADQLGIKQAGTIDAFGLYVRLQHGGDFKAAIEALEPYVEHADPRELPDPTAPPKPKRAAVPEGPRVSLPDFTGIELKRVRWLWEGRIPLGGLTLLAGREGEGKSTIAVDAMARVTTGTSKGEYAGIPRDVVIVATEDSAEHTIKPRLVAAGADISRVHYVQMLDPGDSLSLPVHIPDLEKACVEHDVALIVLDPLLSRLGGNLDSHKDADVRRALEPLGGFCDRTQIAILGLIHLNKSGSTDPLQAVMASRAFTAFARSVLFAMVDPSDEARRLLGLVKSNLGRTDLPTLSYTFDPVEVGWDEGPIVATRIEWGDDSSIDIASALQIGQEERGALHEASEWLRDFMDMEGGSCPASVAIVAATKKPDPDIAKRTLQRAADKLKLTKRKVGTPPTVIWAWSTDSERCQK